ncbi:MAG: RNA methyltransferase [Acidobacteriia bacterium]|nr:RNA methyltransferase [Terriglobia bacterium]
MQRHDSSRTTNHGPRAAVGRAEWVAGFHAVLAVLDREAARTEVVWIAEGLGGPRARQVLEAVRTAGVRYASVPRRKLDEVAAGTAHNGFAVRLAPAPLAEAESLLDPVGQVCLLGLDGLEDGHNLGAVVRSAAAFALGGVIVAGPHPPPLGGAAAKVAAGTLPLVRIAHVGSLGDFALAAKEAGFWVYGADAGGTPLDRVELPERLLLCLGGEAGGLRAKTRRALDGAVAIPLAAGVESLNLSVAAGVLAWEWRRRFPLPPGPGTGPRAPGTEHRQD